MSRNRGIPRLAEVSRQGRCYELAFKAFQSGGAEAGWILVHGTALLDDCGSTRRGGHAWLERGATVYDPVEDRFMNSRLYAARFDAKTDRRYSKVEAALALIASRHYGPWEETS